MFFIKWIILLIVQVTNAGVTKTDLLPNTTVCGVSGHFKFPWMALVVYRLPNMTDDFFCGGFLISERYVMTAAECIQQIVFRKWKLLGVRLGEFNLNKNPDCIKTVSGKHCAPPPLDLKVEEQIAHEDYLFLRGTPEHDIGLIRLEKKVDFTETVTPICLPSTPEERSRTYVGQRLTVAGWGEIAYGLPASVKFKLDIPVTDYKMCKFKYSEIGVGLGNGQFCAGGEAGRGTCRGDAGNAVMGTDVGKHGKVRSYGIGIISFQAGFCGREGWPSVYTNISAYMPWVLNKLKP